MKRVAVLGSTGSIGKKALEIIASFPKKFKLESIACGSNVEELAKQITKFRPEKIGIVDKEKAASLGSRKNLFVGEEGIVALSKDRDVDIVIVAINTSRALSAILAAVECGKSVALANKEALVMAGSIIMRKARKHKAMILPIDSEQSAIWQCLNGNKKTDLKNIYLTASGGPLNKVSAKRFKHLTKKEILQHPRWNMGKKITVDSATLMNKGLEVIEAMWLFDVDVAKIKVVIHPQAIIHSMVEFNDGSVLAQLGITDMRLPIQYALSFPERLKNLPGLDFGKLENLEFSLPDLKKFPCLALSFAAAKRGGSLPCVLNAADEEAVGAFLENKIKFNRIAALVANVMARHKIIDNPTLTDIYRADNWAREETKELICRL